MSGDEDWRTEARFPTGERPLARRQGRQHVLSAMLKEAFDGTAAEPLPAPIVDLLRQLDAGAADEDLTSPPGAAVVCR